MPAPFTTPVALSVPFEPNRDPHANGQPGSSGLESTDVQNAIEEAKQDSLDNDRYGFLAHYGGNAGAGRYLEFFTQEASDVSPIYVSAAARLRSVTCQTTAANATCTIGFFDLNVSAVTPVYSFNMTAQKRVAFVGSPNLGLFPANALIAIKVISGSINTPEIVFFLSSSS